MPQINWNAFLQALAWGAACLTALVGACWGLFYFGYTRGKDIGQSELSACKALNEAKLPEITSGFLAVNKELRESLKVFDWNKTLEAENASYQKQLVEAAKDRADLDVAKNGLQVELQTVADRERRLRDEIGKFNGDSRRFTLTKNHAERLGKGHSVGLSEADTPTQLKIVQDNKAYVMSAGNSIPVDFGDKQCVLTLISMEWTPNTSGEFDWSCTTK
jgi:hypothetical protein